MKGYFSLLLLMSVSVLIFPVNHNSGIYDRIGIIAEHGMHGAVPEENIDLFTGNLTLRFKDIALPGPNGFDLIVWRVYNSKILQDRLSAGPSGAIQQETQSYIGLGWSMHMGRVHNYNTDQPVIEFPDGRWESANKGVNGSTYFTKGFLKYDKSNKKLYFKDGTVWTFGSSQKTLTYDGTNKTVYAVSKIENSYGHVINIEYQIGSNPALKKITDSLGREINFVLDSTKSKLVKIGVRNSTGTTVYYYYDVDTFSSGGYGYPKLEKYDPPELAASTYKYSYDNNDNSENKYELTEVITSYGGVLRYEYEDHDFYYYTKNLATRVISKKTLKTSSSAISKIWTYSYPSYKNTSEGIVTVNGPVYDTKVTYRSLKASDSPYDDGWKIGLIKKKWFTDNSSIENYTWTNVKISNALWIVLNMNMGPIRAPLLYSIAKSTNGDTESKIVYGYENGLNVYGLPNRIYYYGGPSGTSLKNYKDIEYYFQSNSTFESKYMLDYISKDELRNSGGTKYKETKTSYYSSSGKLGAIDWIKKWKSGSTYLTWDYTYSSTNPNNITISINLPGSGGGTETYNYRYGTLAKLKKPGYTEFDRSISSRTSVILNETNRFDAYMIFSYDNLNRIERINMPSGYNDINASWSKNAVTITQGNNKIIKYWDGIGRDLGYREVGDNMTIHFRKDLDAEGRVVSENKGSGSSTHKYSYLYNNAGSITRITDPRGKITKIFLYDDYKKVVDPNNESKLLFYEWLPGLITQLDDPSALSANYTYDPIGRITQVKYNNSRTQSYSYNGLDQVKSESHPETGSITYTYDSEGNLYRKSWGGVNTTYSYNSSNQIRYVDDGSERITYNYYSSSGVVSSLSSSKSWYRDNISYNKFGLILSERQNLPGLGRKTTSYEYDGNNNLKKIIYPNGVSANYTNNGLNMPETLSFGIKSLISQVAYGVNKQPTSMTISGNGTSFSASYKANGILSSMFYKKSGSTIFGTTYIHDNVGNITSLTGTSPSLNASFVYDSLYRLESASYNGGESYNYTYDYYGNLETAKKNGATIFNRSYTSKNRINSNSFGYDSRGNITKSPGLVYTRDRKNRVTTLTKDTGETLGAYTYNERGLRLSADRMLPPSIIVTVPISESTWYTGDTETISWDKKGLLSTLVKITLIKSETEELIVESTANSGSFNWTLPDTLETGEYQIKVTTIDETVSGLSQSFNIVKRAIHVTSPNGGNSWEIGSTQNITWTTSGLSNNVKITLWKDNSIIGLIANDIDPSLGAYSWTVGSYSDGTVESGTGYKIKIREQGGDSFITEDISDNGFNISQIAVTSPNGNENWGIGSTQNITWNASNFINNIKITLWKDGTLIGLIATDIIPGTGIYSWLVGNYNGGTAIAGTGYYIKIREKGGDAFTTEDISDATFQLNADPVIDLILPNGGEEIAINRFYDITWIAYNLTNNIKITLWKDDVLVGLIAKDVDPSAGNYRWSIGNHENGLAETGTGYKIKIREQGGDTFTTEDTSNSSFTLTSSPEVNVLTPNGGGNYPLKSKEEITWTTSNLINNIKITLWKDDVLVGLIATDVDPALGTYSWSVGDYNGGVAEVGTGYKIKIREIGGEDYITEDTSDTYFSINADPFIKVISPNGGEDLSLTRVHEITWNTGNLTNNVKITLWKDEVLFGLIATDVDPSSKSYSWIVGEYNGGPAVAGSNYKIKIREQGGDTFLTEDNSDDNFTISTAPSIDVISPNGGENFSLGSIQKIIWNASGLINNIKITLYKDNTIIGLIANDINPLSGSYSWKAGNYIGGIVLTGTGYQIKIREQGGVAFTAEDFSDSSFTLNNNPFIFIKSPNGGEDLFLNYNYNIRWNADNLTNNVKITLWKDSVLIGLIANDVDPEIGTYSWVAGNYGNGTAIAGTGYKIKIREQGGVAFTTEDNSDLAFEISAGVKVISPNGGENWSKNSVIPISWNSGNISGNVKLILNKDGAIVGEIATDIPVENKFYNWTVGNYDGGDVSAGTGYSISIETLDGLYIDESDLTFNIDVPGPSISLTTPFPGDILALGATYNINWQSNDITENIRLILVKDEVEIGEIATDIAITNGTYSWTVGNCGESTVASSFGYSIRIKTVDDLNEDDSDGSFEITESQSSSMRLTSPNGGENINSGDAFPIEWDINKDISNVKIEYSIDNGSSYQTIINNTDNNGEYNWNVPYDVSSDCLIRISDAYTKNNISSEKNLEILYDLRFKLDKNQDIGDIFTIYLGEFKKKSLKQTLVDNVLIPKLNFIYDNDDRVYAEFNGYNKNIGSINDIEKVWNNIKIILNLHDNNLSLWLNGRILFKNISVPYEYIFDASISMSGNVVIDDFEVNIDMEDKKGKRNSELETKPDFKSLFVMDFENKKSEELNKFIASKTLDASTKNSQMQLIDDFESLKNNKVLKLNWDSLFIKKIDVPKSPDFDISDKVFKIMYNEEVEGVEDIKTDSLNENALEKKYDYKMYNDDVLEGFSLNLTAEAENTHGPNIENISMSGTMAGNYIKTYYIWSYDGKLLAEYDEAGVCTKNYIYMGGKMIAEYLPATDTYYYFMSDQINSSRVVTNGSGIVVYSAAHGPYGDIQKVWTNTYDPKPKFSGKERESYSNLDYFGARYYDNKSFRFTSVDPVMNRDATLANPQLWNLYAYARNNPITYFDPDGRDTMKIYKHKNGSTYRGSGKGFYRGSTTHFMFYRGDGSPNHQKTISHGGDNNWYSNSGKIEFENMSFRAVYKSLINRGFKEELINDGLSVVSVGAAGAGIGLSGPWGWLAWGIGVAADITSAVRQNDGEQIAPSIIGAINTKATKVISTGYSIYNATKKDDKK